VLVGDGSCGDLVLDALAAPADRGRLAFLRLAEVVERQVVEASGAHEWEALLPGCVAKILWAEAAAPCVDPRVDLLFLGEGSGW